MMSLPVEELLVDPYEKNGPFFQSLARDARYCPWFDQAASGNRMGFTPAVCFTSMQLISIFGKGIARIASSGLCFANVFLGGLRFDSLVCMRSVLNFMG